MADAKNSKCNTIMVGSSYARFGMEDQVFENNGTRKNLSLASQDFYYASKIAEKVINSNPGIRNVIFGAGYYQFYSDLSKCKNEGELARVSQVYEPILGDAHNAIILSPKVLKPENELWNLQKIISYYSRIIYEKNDGQYFHKDRTRFSWKYCLWRNSNLRWCEISEEEKETACKQRADMHQSACKHLVTYQENVQILNRFLHFCGEKHITCWMLIFPFTKGYLKNLDYKLKEDFYNTLEYLQGEIHLIDLNDSDHWSDMDFNDTDHLSDIGAEKVARLLDGMW